VGNDVFGRGTFAGGGFNIDVALRSSHVLDIDIAVSIF
jgi:hypothetical protein